MATLRIALAQINLTVGDIEGNATRIARGLERARRDAVDIVLFPELTLTGYPPEDLLLKPGFLRATREALDQLVPLTEGLTAVVGFPDRRDDLHNAAAVLHDGRIAQLTFGGQDRPCRAFDAFPEVGLSGGDALFIFAPTYRLRHFGEVDVFHVFQCRRSHPVTALMPRHLFREDTRVGLDAVNQR